MKEIPLNSYEAADFCIGSSIMPDGKIDVAKLRESIRYFVGAAEGEAYKREVRKFSLMKLVEARNGAMLCSTRSEPTAFHVDPVYDPTAFKTVMGYDPKPGDSLWRVRAFDASELETVKKKGRK